MIQTSLSSPSPPPFLLPQETDTQSQPWINTSWTELVKPPKLTWTIVTDWVPGHLGPSLTLMEPCKVAVIFPLYREGRSWAAWRSHRETRSGIQRCSRQSNTPTFTAKLPPPQGIWDWEASGKMLETALGDGPTGDTKGPQGPKEGITLLACCLPTCLSLLWNLRNSY